MKVGISNFIRLNTNPKVFSGDWDDLRNQVTENLNNTVYTQGYRDGVVLVPVEPKHFKCPVFKLKDTMNFSGQYKKRVQDEDPRKSTWIDLVDGFEPAKSVNVILYSRNVLLESKNTVTGAEWDMIMIQALDSNEPAPMDPQTLMYNHFQQSGGTTTNMTPEQFEIALKESFLYWKDRILAK